MPQFPIAQGRAFRRAAFVAATAATVLFMPAAAFAQSATTGAAPKDGLPATPSNACAALWRDKSDAGFKAYINCELAESRRRTSNYDTQAADATTIKACGDFLLKGVADKRWTLAQIQAEAGGTFNDNNTCPIAIRHGYDRRASLVP